MENTLISWAHHTLKHLHLINLLKRVKGRVVLSCYESGLYSNLLQGWQKHEVQNRNNRHESRTEILWVKS